MRFGKIVKYVIFSIIPLLILFLSLEFIQRARYSIARRDWGWMFYFNSGKIDHADVSAELNKKFIIIDGSAAVNNVIKAANSAVMPQKSQSENSAASPKSKQDNASFVEMRRKYILCLGGSSTAGINNGNEHKYPYLLNKMIDESSLIPKDVKYSVVNLGLAGETSDEYMNVIEFALKRISPEAIIFYCGYNDIFIKDVNKIYATFTAKLSPAYAFLERYSLLLLTLKEKFIISRINRAGSYENNAGRYKKLEKEFYRNVDDCVELALKHNIEVVLIPEVLMAKDFGGLSANYENYAGKYKNIAFILKEIARKRDCEFINLQGYFDADNFKRYFADPVHLTDEGNAVLSALIFENSSVIRKLIGTNPLAGVSE
ncbi:MAG: SGNH/GDSL hydrolase family protein [Candidatus Omnitrophota bacterium]